MKKLFTTIGALLIAFIWYHWFIWGNYSDGYYIVQPNRTILQNKDDKNFFISDVLNIKETKRYLLLLRMPERFYTCPHASVVTCKPILKFTIVNKIKKHIYETDNYIKFNKKLQELNINKNFSKEEIQIAQKKIVTHEKICNSSKKTNSCKEDFLYPVEKF